MSLLTTVLVPIGSKLITVNSAATLDSTPEITGTIEDALASVSIDFDGNTYAATNNGDGTWTLPDNAISPPLDSGRYLVVATAVIDGITRKATGYIVFENTQVAIGSDATVAYGFADNATALGFEG